MVAVRRGREDANILVDVTRLPELSTTTLGEDGTLRLGAALTHREVAENPQVLRMAPVLAQACHQP